MSRVDDFLDLVDDPARQALTPGDPADDALLALMVHVAFSDGALDEAELDFLERVLPGRERDQLAAWVHQVGSQPLPMKAIARALPTDEQRWKGLRFAARMAWKDGEIQSEEYDLLVRLAHGLELGPDAVDQVLQGMLGQGGGDVDPTRLGEILDGVTWSAVQILDEPAGGPLARVAPSGAHPVRVVAVDEVAVAAFYPSGLAARFMEGVAFIAWSELVTYTRVATMGAAVQLHTEAGRTWTLVDARMRGLTLILDRLFGGASRQRAPGPQVVQVKGDGQE